MPCAYVCNFKTATERAKEKERARERAVVFGREREKQREKQREKKKLLSSLGNVKAELPLSTPTCTHFDIGCIDHSYTIKLT